MIGARMGLCCGGDQRSGGGTLARAGGSEGSQEVLQGKRGHLHGDLGERQHQDE